MLTPLNLAVTDDIDVIEEDEVEEVTMNPIDGNKKRKIENK
jgi:hypothetical protein